MGKYKGRLIIGLLGLAASVSAGTRIFTDSSGRSVEAEVVGYNGMKEEVTILRAGARNPITVPIGVFCTADQDYIQEWSRCQDLMDSKLTADISRLNKQDTRNSHATSASTEVYTDHFFKIEFDNRTYVSFDQLDLEYVIYYEQEHHTRRGYDVEKKEGALYHQELISLPAREELEYITEPVKLYTWNTYSLEPVDADIEGIRVRLSLTTSSDEKITREFVYPEGLELAWVSETKDAQKRVPK